MKLNEIIVCVVTDIGISFGMLIKFDIVEKMAEKEGKYQLDSTEIKRSRV